MQDYENAEEETLREARTSAIEERTNLISLIDGFRLSRKNTVIKLIKLIHQMHERGLWLTYKTAEEADQGFRSPHDKPESYLRRGPRSSYKEKPMNRDSLL